MNTRPAGEDDAEAIVELLMRGFATYGEWQPGWAPTEELREEQLAAWRSGLRFPDAWTLVAEEDGALVGIARFGQGRTEPRSGDPVPGLAHLGALFVDPEHWRRGLGRELLTRATDEMRARGYERARLLVPAGNRRARDVYERHGFEAVGDWPEPLMGLALVEYRLELRR
jgi:ribosomal protein S18 acetylase RimI-like enzyme